MQLTQGKFALYDVAGFGLWLYRLDPGRPIRLIQNHHTWYPSYEHFDGSNQFQLLEGMESSHLERGFAEIAQHLTTFPDGTIATGRGFDKDPAGIKGANLGAICIEHLGNFDAGQDIMSDRQRAAIVTVNALLCRKFVLQPDPTTLVYHHWFDLDTGERKNGAGVTKSCPGTNFFGGNTVGSAVKNFIPLIEQALMMTDDQAPA